MSIQIICRDDIATYAYTITATGKVTHMGSAQYPSDGAWTIVGFASTFQSGPVNVKDITYTLDDLFDGSMLTLGSYPIILGDDFAYILEAPVKEIHHPEYQPKHKAGV